MGNRMQSPAHGECREGRRAWTAGCGLGELEMSTQEGGGRGLAEGKHGAGDGHGERVRQEVAEKKPEVEDDQQGRGRRGDERREHGPPDDGSSTESAAAEAATVGYRIASRCGHRGRAARRRPRVQASLSARHQGTREACRAAVEKSGSELGTGVKEAYNDAKMGIAEGTAPEGVLGLPSQPWPQSPSGGGMRTTGI